MHVTYTVTDKVNNDDLDTRDSAVMEMLRISRLLAISKR